MTIAKVIEISSESTKGFDDAIRSGMEKAAKTLDNIQSAWVKDQIVLAEDGKVNGYRVHMHVTFKVN